MPLLQPTQKIQKNTVKLHLNKQVLHQIQDYCTWAEIENIDDFFEQAARLILKKDKAWRSYLNQPKQGKANAWSNQ